MSRARKSSNLPTCAAPGCDAPAPVMLADRNGSLDVCYGHGDNTLTAIRAAIVAAAGVTA